MYVCSCVLNIGATSPACRLPEMLLSEAFLKRHSSGVKLVSSPDFVSLDGFLGDISDDEVRHRRSSSHRGTPARRKAEKVCMHGSLSPLPCQREPIVKTPH